MLCCCGDGYFDNQQLGSQFMGSALCWKHEPSSSDVTLPDVWLNGVYTYIYVNIQGVYINCHE